jgi:hypothetical protein
VAPQAAQTAPPRVALIALLDRFARRVVLLPWAPERAPLGRVALRRRVRNERREPPRRKNSVHCGLLRARGGRLLEPRGAQRLAVR